MGIDAGEERAKFCLELGANAAANSKVDNLIAVIENWSERHGADVMIDMVGGDVFDVGRHAIASGGRIVIIGFTSGRIPEIQVNRLLLRNFASVGMNAFRCAKEMQDCYRRVAELCAQGKLRPVVDAVHPFEEAARALTRIAEGRVRGKAVVRVADPLDD